MSFGYTDYLFTPGCGVKATHYKVSVDSTKVEEANSTSQPPAQIPEPELLSEVPVSEKIIKTAQSYGVASSLYQFRNESSAVRAGIALKVLEGVYETGYREKAYIYAFSEWEPIFHELSHNKAHQAEWLIGVSKFLKHEINGNPHQYERIQAMNIADDLITNQMIRLPESRLKDFAFLFIENQDVYSTIHWLKKANATKTDFMDAAVIFMHKNLFKAGVLVLAHSSQIDVNNHHDAPNPCRIPIYIPPFIKKIVETIMEPAKLADVSARSELINEYKKNREIGILIKTFCCMGYFDSAIETAKKEDLAKGSIVHLLEMANFLASCLKDCAGPQIYFSEEMKKTIFSRFLDNSSSKIQMHEGYINLLLQIANQQSDRKKWIQDIAVHNLCPLDTAIKSCQLLEDPGLSYEVISAKKIPKETKKAREMFLLLRDYLTKSTRRDWSDITTAFLESGFDEEVIKTGEIWKNWQKNLPTPTEKKGIFKNVASDVNTAVFLGIAHLALKNERGWEYLKQAAQWEKECQEIDPWGNHTFLHDAVKETTKTFIESTKLSERKLLNKKIRSDVTSLSSFKFSYQKLVEIFEKNPIHA